MTLKISLVDNDYVVCSKTDLPENGDYNSLAKFLKDMNDEMIPGKTAFLEIEGSEVGPVTFEISKFEQ